LATHLARKIISRKKKDTLPDEKITLLWTDEEVAEIKKKIISQIGTDDTASLTPEQAHQKDQDELNEKFGNKLPPPNKSVPRVEKPAEEVTKKDVILELEKRGVKVDQEKSKDELLAQLMELEAQG
jgi:spore germination cell wall hydrolase CwlJ-like protein